TLGLTPRSRFMWGRTPAARARRLGAVAFQPGISSARTSSKNSPWPCPSLGKGQSLGRQGLVRAGQTYPAPASWSNAAFRSGLTLQAKDCHEVALTPVCALTKVVMGNDR